VDDSVAWLKAQSRDDEPFFLNCSFGIPHPAFVSSDWWLDKIDIDRVALPRKPVTERHPVMDYMSATKHCEGEFDDEDVLAIRRTYYAMIAELDAMVGSVFRAVSDLGLLDRTYIIFMSDHGEMNMEHDQWLKNAPYEASVRVPLMISGPGVQEETVIDDLVSLVDFYPTLMDIAGLPHLEDLDGRSLMSALSGESGGRDQRVLCQYHSNFANTGIFILRRGPWKYIAYPGYEPQLFNLDKDPAELTNLARDKRETARNMDRALRRMVDYPVVDAKAKAYDRECFLKWQRSLGKKKCRETLAELFHAPWTEEHTEQLEMWLKG
jgi:arylsulfatase K